MSENNGGFFAKLRRPSAKYSLLTLLTIGFFSGIFFWGGFNTAMEATNTFPFCISCHEMRDRVSGIQETIHYKNRTGVRAVCVRLPRAEGLGAQDGSQVQASKEVLGHHLIIDTPRSSRKTACAGHQRVGPHEGLRFARMPQLPQASTAWTRKSRRSVLQNAQVRN